MTDYPSVAGIYTPEMYGAAAGNSATANTAAFQRCLDAAPIGAAIFFTRPYTLNGNIKYHGGRRIMGSKNAKLTLAAGVTAIAMFVPYSWFTTTQAEMQTVTQADKFRPVFDGVYIDGNRANGGVFTQADLLMTSSEAVVTGCVFASSSSWGLVLTPFNALGQSQDDGNNLFGNQFVHNRFTDNGYGAFFANDGDGAISTDSWFCDNSCTGGTYNPADANSGTAVHIETGQGWKVNDNQISAVMKGITVVRENGTVTTGNIINTFGGGVAGGRRWGIRAGINSTRSINNIFGNTIEARTTPEALADGTSFWSMIDLFHRGAGVNMIVNPQGNAMNAGGFSGTSGKLAGISLLNAGNGFDLRGIIDGNSFTTDENVGGNFTTPLILPAGHNFILGQNINGTSLVTI